MNSVYATVIEIFKFKKLLSKNSFSLTYHDLILLIFGESKGPEYFV